MKNAPPEHFDRIESAANPVVKLMRALQRKKDRREHRLFLACGTQSVRNALDHGWAAQHALIADQPLPPATIALAHAVQGAGGRVLRIPPSLMDGVAGKDGRFGIVATFRIRRYVPADLHKRGCGRWLALYEVRDPGNLGSLLRTAHAAMVDGVVLIGRCCDPYGPECVRASTGTLFALPLVHLDIDGFLVWQRHSGARTIGAVVGGDVRFDQTEPANKSILLLGNERSGLPAILEAACNQRVRIPMRADFHSLNLASAGAVLIYAMWQQSDYVGAA